MERLEKVIGVISMCNYDQRICAEAIVKDGWVYIVDDYHGVVKMKFSEFDAIVDQYNDQKV